MNSNDEAWHPLLAELDAWHAGGRLATLWWRDDDAVAPTPALDRMLRLVERFRVPLGLAVIPARLTADLAPHLRDLPLVSVLQHGYLHRNYATAGERAAEFGAQRPLELRLRETSEGRRILEQFQHAVPIFVPPWNRYDRAIAPGLAQQGLRAVSAFAASEQLSGKICECNCQVDIISWRITRGFAGLDKTVRKLTEHLRARRLGELPIEQATGVLSHHLDHDDGCWEFLEAVFARTVTHPAAKWITPMDAVARIESP